MPLIGLFYWYSFYSTPNSFQPRNPFHNGAVSMSIVSIPQLHSLPITIHPLSHNISSTYNQADHSFVSKKVGKVARININFNRNIIFSLTCFMSLQIALPFLEIREYTLQPLSLSWQWGHIREDFRDPWALLEIREYTPFLYKEVLRFEKIPSSAPIYKPRDLVKFRTPPSS